MKKIITFAILLVISVSPVFKGLFFPFEMYIFFSALSVLCAAYFVIKLVKKEEIILKDWTIYPGVLLILAYCFAFTKAVNQRGNIEATLQVLVYYLVFLVVYDFFRENTGKIPGYFIVTFSSMGFATALIGLAGYTRVFPGLTDTLNSERIGSTFQYANTAAIYFLIVIIFIISLIINSYNIFIKALLAGAGNVVFLAFFFTSSRGAFLVMPVIIFLVLFITMPKSFRFKSIIYILCITLPAIAAMKGYYANSKIMNIISASKWVILSAGISITCVFIISYLFTLKVNNKVKYGLLGITSAAAIVFVFVKWGMIFSLTKAIIINNVPKVVINRLLDINFETINVVARFLFFKDAIKLIKNNWLFGLGGGGFASLYQSVQDKYYAANLVHNHYLQVFVEAGILGILSFVSITTLTCINFIYARIKLNDTKDKIYTAAFFSAFLALAAHSVIDFNLSYSGVSLIYWSLIAISAAYFFKARAKAVTISPKFQLKNVSAISFLIILCICCKIKMYKVAKQKCILLQVQNVQYCKNPLQA